MEWNGMNDEGWNGWMEWMAEMEFWRKAGEDFVNGQRHAANIETSAHRARIMKNCRL